MSFESMWAALEPVGRDGRTGGYRRFAWTAEDHTLRDWFAAECRARGLDLTEDRMGNQWAWWGDPDAAAAQGRKGVVAGSHLDSVPDGGAFDGPLGVVSALAAIDVLQARARTEGWQPSRPIGVVNFVDEQFQVPMIFLLLLYLFHTTGELFLSPVGLSAISKLSVVKVLSTMMATWFLASAWAQYVGGIIAGLTETETVAGAALDNQAALNSSLQVFEMLGWWGVGIGVVLSIASFFLKGMAHGVFEEKPELAQEAAPTEAGRAARPQES